MSYILFLDDCRKPFQSLIDDPRPIVVCLSGFEVMSALMNRGLPSHFSFDWNLGQSYLNGAIIARDFIGFVKRSKTPLPDNFTYSIHSTSKGGAEDIRTVLNRGLAELGFTGNRETVVRSSEEFYD